MLCLCVCQHVVSSEPLNGFQLDFVLTVYIKSRVFFFAVQSCGSGSAP